jgi:hypothetical protein
MFVSLGRILGTSSHSFNDCSKFNRQGGKYPSCNAQQRRAVERVAHLDKHPPIQALGVCKVILYEANGPEPHLPLEANLRVKRQTMPIGPCILLRRHVVGALTETRQPRTQKSASHTSSNAGSKNCMQKPR